MLGVRRKLLQRVVEFDSFELCYPNDKDRAKANVADIQKLVILKNTITRYENYLTNEQHEKIKVLKKKNEKIRQSKDRFECLRQEFSSLFFYSESSGKRKKLESVLNNLFPYFKISIKEAFTISDGESGKIYEQIDGVVEINHYLTLLEMKWEKTAVSEQTELHIGNSIFFCTYVLPGFIKEFQLPYPQVTLILTEGGNKTLLKKLLDGCLDFPLEVERPANSRVFSVP